MVRKVLLFLRLLREAPGNPVFQLVMSGRFWWARFAVLVLLVVFEVCLLFWRSNRLGAGRSWDDFVGSTLGFHAIAMPVLLVSCIWAFSRSFTRAQKEDLWLTNLSPREMVLGAMLPPALAAFVVVIVVPVILIAMSILLFIRPIFMGLVDFFWEWFVMGYVPVRVAPFGSPSMIALSCWYVSVYVSVAAIVAGTMFHSMIRSSGPTVYTALLALFRGVCMAVLVSAMLLIGIAVMESRGGMGVASLANLLMVPGLVLAILLPLATATFFSLAQFPARRWFAEASADLAGEHDWFAFQRGWRRLLSGGVGLGVFPHLPRLAVAALAGALVGVICQNVSAVRNVLIHAPVRSMHEHYWIAAFAISALAGGMLALRWGNRFAWLRPMPLHLDRLRSSIAGPAIVLAVIGHGAAFFWMVASQDSNWIMSIRIILVAALVTAIPTCFLLSTLGCLWRLRPASGWTTLAVSLILLLLAMAMYWPGTEVGRMLLLAGILPLMSAIVFWLHGGSDVLFQMLFDEERRRIVAASPLLEPLPTVPEGRLRPTGSPLHPSGLGCTVRTGCAYPHAGTDGADVHEGQSRQGGLQVRADQDGPFDPDP